jgi:hypothetical protein
MLRFLSSVFCALFLAGCAYQGTGKGCLVIGYQHSTYEIGLPVSSGSPIDKDGRGYGNGNAAVLIDCQAIVSRGSGNSNNVAPVLSIPAVGGL